MGSLESCIRKAGKAFSKEDAAAIRAIRNDLIAAGRGKTAEGDVNQKAVEEYLDIIQLEKEHIMQQVAALGGTLAPKNLSPSKFAEQAAKNLEESARTFPRKGVTRAGTELNVVDNKTGDRLQDNYRTPAGQKNIRAAMNNMSRNELNKDPLQRVLEVASMRGPNTIEMMYPGFYNLPVKNVLAIVNNFDPKAALSIAKNFEILPQSARKLIPANYDQAAIKRLEQSIINRDIPGKNRDANGVLNDSGDWFHGYASTEILEWVEEHETLPLYYKVEDTAARDLVNSNPDHPLSAINKLAAIVEDAKNAKVGPLRKLVHFLVDSKNSTIEAALGAVPQTKLKDFVKYGMDAIGLYTSEVKRMDAWMNTQMEKYHDLAKEWLDFNTSKLTKKNAKMLMDFMHASTLSGVDVPEFEMPDKAAFKKMNKNKRAMWLKRQADYELLKPFWDKLGKAGKQVTYQKTTYEYGTEKSKPIGDKTKVSEAQALYLKVRDSYAYMRESLIDNLEQRVNETEANKAAKMELIATLRQQFEAGKITPYFALARFGNHQAAAYAKNDETGEWEVVAYIHREKRRDRDVWVEQMRAEGLRARAFEKGASDLDTLNQIDPNFVAKVTELLSEKTVTETDPETGEEISVPGTAIQDQIWQMYLRTLPEMSARTAYIHRKGRLGFSGDALRAFADHAFHGTHQTAKLRFGFTLGELLTGVKEESVILKARADDIKNMIQLDWRPKGFEEKTIHEVLIHHPIGGPIAYRNLYEKAQKDAGLTVNYNEFHEPSYIKARDQLLKESEIDGPWAVPLANEITNRHKYNMNPKSGALATKLTALGFLWFLSTSPAAGALNLTQQAIAGYPVLRARFNGLGAGQELLKASQEYATAPWKGDGKNHVDRLTSRLKNDMKDGKELDEIGERAAMQFFEDIGIFSKTRTRDLQGLSEGGSTYSMRQERALEITGWIFHKSEEMNRAVMALAAYRLGRKKFANEKGMSLQDQHNKAAEWAEELVEIAHFDYTNTNRPRWMQGDAGRVVFLFRNYSLNMQYRLIRDFRDGVWKNDNIPMEARKEARDRFLGIIGMTSLFAGIGGWPLFWAVEAVANNLVGDDDDELYFAFGGDPNNPFDSKNYLRKTLYQATENYIAEGWGETVAGSIMKGPWSQLTGADLSARASLNNLWIREIPENLKDDPSALMSHLSGEALGPMWGLGVNIARGAGDIMNDEPMRGAEKLVPKFVGDAFKALRYAQQGAQTYQDDMILSPDEFSSLDLFLQFSGFTPTKLSNRYEQNRAVKDMDTKLAARKSKLMNQLFTAWRIKDKRSAKAAFQEIAEWNKKNPLEPIDLDSIRQSASSRAAYDMRTVGGIAVDKRRHYLHEELRFTDRPKRGTPE